MGNTPLYVLKMTTLLCATILTIYSLDHAIRRDFGGPRMATCIYSSNDRKGVLADWMKEDNNIIKEELKQFSATSFKGPYAPSDYLLDIKRGRLFLESRAKDGRLRMVEITATNDKIAYVYLPDDFKCSSDNAGTILENDAKISSVKILTLKGTPHQ